MLSPDDLIAYRKSFYRLVRKMEERACRNNPERLTEIGQASDDFLAKRALWTGVIIAGPLAFIALPLLISLLSIFVPPQAVEILWILAKGVMALVLVVFAICAYLTVKSQ